MSKPSHTPYRRERLVIGETIVEAEVAEQDGTTYLFIDPRWEACGECHGTGWQQCTEGIAMECPDCGGDGGSRVEDDEWDGSYPVDDPDESDDFDPNRCPDCGGDITYDDVDRIAWCADPSCMWIEGDDDEEEDEDASPVACRVCGCTDLDCSGCIERTGEPCHWVEPDLCSACATDGLEAAGVAVTNAEED